jgi:hypothetical protein
LRYPCPLHHEQTQETAAHSTEPLMTG